MDANAEPDWQELSIKLLAYAQRRVEHCAYRSPSAVKVYSDQITIDGKDAKEFVEEAIEAHKTNRRKWNRQKCPDRLRFLKGIVRSLTSNAVRRVSKHPTVDPTSSTEVDLLTAESPTESYLHPDQAVILQEEREEQARIWEDFKASIREERDEELLQLIGALESELWKPADIQKKTGIAARRVSELKRKLEDKIYQFFVKNRKKY